MQKVRGHTCLRQSGNIVLPLIVDLRFHILFHSPHRGAFHLSLTVLVHYRSSTQYLALGGGPPRFLQDFSCPAVLGYLTQDEHAFSLTRLSLSMAKLSSFLS